jgi:hypothetical protein
MFKGLGRLVQGTKLNLTNAHQQSATKRSGSVHKTNCKGRTVTVPQVSQWKHQDCCHNRNCNWSGPKSNSCTDPCEQVLWWQPFPTRTRCGLWASAVSQTEVTSTKGPRHIQRDPFPTVNQADFSHLLLRWKETDASTPYDNPVHFYPMPTPRHITSCSTN